MSASGVVAKALRCIDEIYPYDNGINGFSLPVEEFLDEAVSWAIDTLPRHLFKNSALEVSSVEYDGNGVCTFTLSKENSLGKLSYVKFKDWDIPVIEPIYEDSLLYKQQKNPVLRGNPSRPQVVICANGKLEAYTTNATDKPEVRHIAYDADSLTVKTVDVTAWKLAEIVLLSINDAQSALACTARVNELLQQLVL